MNGEALYERYKDALRRGHIASIQGRLEEALDAYAEAAHIAPERATPHSSAGSALLRRRRPEEAIRCFEEALRLSPGDEGSLVGRAEALAGLDRRREAADAWSAMADARVAAGRLAEAVDAARRALELAEGRERRRTLERLVARVRASEPDEPDRAALDRAMRTLEGVAVITAAGQTAVPAGATASAAATEPESRTEEPAPEPAPVVPGALDRGLPADVVVDALARAAEAGLDHGDARVAVERLLDLASVHRRAGNRDAALDACYVGLAVAPDDVGLHLALAELYVERGWTALASEKLDLLDRLATLDGDVSAGERLASARARSS